MTNGTSKLPARWQGLALAAALAGWALLPNGCASHGHGAAKHAASQKPACYPCGPCAGYFPTCWKMWPEECGSCPIYGAERPAMESPEAQALPPEGLPLPPAGDEIISPERGGGPQELQFSPAEEPGDEGPQSHRRGFPMLKKASR